MAKLIYSALTSLDGYVADEDGNFDWAAPDEEVHAFVNDLERPIGTYLYGRRMYEVMSFWQTADTLPDQSPAVLDFAAIWQAADKIVFSRTLEDASTPKTRIEQDFDPEAIRQLKASAASDISIGGPGLAAQAIRAGLVDEFRLFVSPVVVGSGNPSLPDDVRIPLELLDEHRFGNGVVYLRYVAEDLISDSPVNLLSPAPLWRFAGRHERARHPRRSGDRPGPVPAHRPDGVVPGGRAPPRPLNSCSGCRSGCASPRRSTAPTLAPTPGSTASAR